MPPPDTETLLKLFRRHAHDVRNHCSGIHLDAALLAELGDDVEIADMAARLKKQVGRIEAELKFLLLQLEEPQFLTLTVGDLIQLWRMKLKLRPPEDGLLVWPEEDSSVSITLDSRLTVQALCELTTGAMERHPHSKLEVAIRNEPQSAVVELKEPACGAQPPSKEMEEWARILHRGGVALECRYDDAAERWCIVVQIPVSSGLTAGIC